MFKEFKEFAIKGNLIDIAVGLVMATAFGLVVSSFVDGVFMPVVGKIFQIGDLSKYDIQISPETVGADGKPVPALAIQIGKFISTIINFLIISWVMFMIVKSVNKMKAPEPAPAPSGPSTEELLGQIRDLLKK